MQRDGVGWRVVVVLVVCVWGGGLGGSIQLRCLIQIEGKLLLHRQCETMRGGMFYSVIVFPITACNSSVVGITP